MNPSQTDAPLTAVATSFARLFAESIVKPQIGEIEIPIFQRDYAQGRQSPRVERIRNPFIHALCSALLPGEPPIELDFIYGDVEANGTFMPLDGQQRLTTLFLLHCHLAWYVGVRPSEQPWAKFSYATRPGARSFCRFLTECRPDLSEAPSKWLTDAAEYLPTWKFDPTIRSMLVVLDALHAWFSSHDIDFQAAWEKLIHAEDPAIRFHLLPMTATGMTDALYIKMNSRGKPLTAFENFKARFEEMLRELHPGLANDFAYRIDTCWTNLIWSLKDRSRNPQIDDELMRYFRFVTEVGAWNSGVNFPSEPASDPLVYLGDLATRVYGGDNPAAKENLAFLFRAFDIWVERNAADAFGSLLTDEPREAAKRLLIFHPFKAEGVNLLRACCEHYGTAAWTFAHTLLLYGILSGFDTAQPTNTGDGMPRRLRILRNLIEASEDEIRAGQRNNMPRLLRDVREVIRNNATEAISAFNQVQKQNELDKAALLSEQPHLTAVVHALEDHHLLRGGLTAFDLSPALFTGRAEAFLRIFTPPPQAGDTPWLEVTGALLAHGDYARKRARWTGYHFVDLGAPRSLARWQSLFRGRQGEASHPLRRPLMSLLDAMAGGGSLQGEIDLYTDAPDTPKDWRYYLVKYPVMRQGRSGRYVFNATGYEACMLNNEVMRSYYADPYLLAAVQASGIGRASIALERWPDAFISYENKPRWLQLKTGPSIRATDSGWQVAGIPEEPQERAAWNLAISPFDATQAPDGTVSIAVGQIGGVDVADRIELGAQLLQALTREPGATQADAAAS